jgi:hypothetical protein
VGIDRGVSTLHVGLTVKVEPAPGTLDQFYDRLRNEAGDAYKVVRHDEWRGGYVDVEVVETAVSEGRVKRFFWVKGGRGYTLAFEAREAVFHRVSAWCDLIASTFELLEPRT